MQIQVKILILLLLTLTASFAQRGAGEQLKEMFREEQIASDHESVADRAKKNVASVTPAQKELDDFLFNYLKIKETPSNDKNAILDQIEDEARAAAMNSYFSKCSFNSLRAVAVINRSAKEGKHKEIQALSEKLAIPLSANYDAKIIPIWFYSVYKASLGIENKLERMKYLNTMAFTAKDKIKTKVFSEYFIGKMIKRMLVKERTLFNNIYTEYKKSQDQANLSDALCDILIKNSMYKDLAYALWVFQPLLGEKTDMYSTKAMSNLAMTTVADKDELEPLFKNLVNN